ERRGFHRSSRCAGANDVPISPSPAAMAHVSAAAAPPPGAGERAARLSRNAWTVLSRYGSVRVVEETDGLPVLLVADVEAGRRLTQPRHLHDVAAQRGQEAGARV